MYPGLGVSAETASLLVRDAPPREPDHHCPRPHGQTRRCSPGSTTIAARCTQSPSSPAGRPSDGRSCPACTEWSLGYSCTRRVGVRSGPGPVVRSAVLGARDTGMGSPLSPAPTASARPSQASDQPPGWLPLAKAEQAPRSSVPRTNGLTLESPLGDPTDRSTSVPAFHAGSRRSQRVPGARITPPTRGRRRRGDRQRPDRRREERRSMGSGHSSADTWESP